MTPVVRRSLMPPFNTASIVERPNLARDLAEVVSQPIFDIARFVEAACHQRLDAILSGGSAERTDARIPSGAALDIERQAGVHEALGICDRPFVESGDTGL